MKERFLQTRRTYLERQDALQHPIALGRWYRRVGRVCLLGAAIAGSIEIFSAIQGDRVSPVTLRSVFNLSPDVTAPSMAPIKAAIELAVDSPLWIVLIVVAAIPYGLAAYRFFKENSAREDAVRRRVRTVL